MRTRGWSSSPTVNHPSGHVTVITHGVRLVVARGGQRWLFLLLFRLSLRFRACNCCGIAFPWKKTEQHWVPISDYIGVPWYRGTVWEKEHFEDWRPFYGYSDIDGCVW